MSFFSFLYSFSDWGLLALRLALAAIFLVHGSQKLKMWKMAPSEQMPATMLRLMKLLSIAEPLGAVAMLIGFLTPLVAIGLSIVMLGALRYKMAVWKMPFTAMDKVGWEFDLLILAAAVAILLVGPGAFSLDRLLWAL